MTKIVSVKARVRVTESDFDEEVVVESKADLVSLIIAWKTRWSGEEEEEALLTPEEALRISQALRDAVDVARTCTKRCLECGCGGIADQDPCACGASNWEPIK